MMAARGGYFQRPEEAEFSIPKRISNLAHNLRMRTVKSAQRSPAEAVLLLPAEDRAMDQTVQGVPNQIIQILWLLIHPTKVLKTLSSKTSN